MLSYKPASSGYIANISCSLCLLVCSFLGFPASITYMITRKTLQIISIANIYLLQKLQKGETISSKQVLKASAFILGIIILSGTMSILMYNITYELIVLLKCAEPINPKPGESYNLDC